MHGVKDIPISFCFMLFVHCSRHCLVLKHNKFSHSTMMIKNPGLEYSDLNSNSILPTRSWAT